MLLIPPDLYHFVLNSLEFVHHSVIMAIKYQNVEHGEKFLPGTFILIPHEKIYACSNTLLIIKKLKISSLFAFYSFKGRDERQRAMAKNINQTSSFLISIIGWKKASTIRMHIYIPYLKKI